MSDAVHIVTFHHGDHVCLFYRDLEEQMAIAAPFVNVGLRRDERCLCVLTKEQSERLIFMLEAAGIDAKKQIERGALWISSPAEAYLAGGRFDREQMVRFLDEGMQKALAAGFTGFRGTGDLSWAALDSHACGDMPEYERLLDKYYPGKPALGICMYDANLFKPRQLDDLMKAHRLALMAHDQGRRAIRIRQGSVFGDVIFDRENPTLFHYAVQQDDSTNLLTVGQESTLTAAIAAVETSLSYQAQA